MTPRFVLPALAASALALGGPACVAAQPAPQVSPPSPPPMGAPPPPGAATAAPPEAAPPGEPVPPPPADAQAPPPSGGIPAGQWVYTQQYGWVWMTYGDAYAYVPPNGSGEPLEYVYYPSYGWTWIAAPWVWGVGPWPYFGPRGPSHFAWYSRGYWREPSRWRYRPVPERSGVAVRGVRPAPQRVGRRAGAPGRGEGRAEGRGGGRGRPEREGEGHEGRR